MMHIIKNIKLSKKISLLSISFLVFLILIGAFSIYQSWNENQKLMELNNSRVAPIIELENIKSDIEYIRTQCNSLMDATDSSTRTTIEKNITNRITTVNKKFALYKSNSDFKTILSNYSKFVAAKNTFITNQSTQSSKPSVSTTAQPNATPTANTNTDKNMGGIPTDMANLDKTKTNLISSLDIVINKHVAAAKQIYKDDQISFIRTTAEYVSVIVICSIIMVILSIIIISSIVIPVRRVTEKLEEISNSNGDLTQRIGYDSKDEIGQLSKHFDIFIEKLQSIISEVAVSAKTISSSSSELDKATSFSTKSLEEISNTIVEIASSTADSAAAAEETTASLAEAANFSEATSSSSKSTAYNSKIAKTSAETGAEKISEIVSSITEIADSSKEVSIIINDLDVSSKKIGNIIEIITSISAQTNLLALNAAIEAARAGEAGKGFSVVAEEIRKLADESNNAAMQISNLVKDNQLKSASAVGSVEQVEEKVALGVTKASEVKESIQSIINNTQNIVKEIEQIENANNEQAVTTKEIEKAISNIAATSNKMAEGTENISASLQEQLSTMTEIEKTTNMLSQMSQKLNEITSGFKIK